MLGTYPTTLEAISPMALPASLAVDATAVGSLKDLKAGDKVKLTCRDNDKGEHQAVTKIAKETK